MLLRECGTGFEIVQVVPLEDERTVECKDEPGVVIKIVPTATATIIKEQITTIGRNATPALFVVNILERILVPLRFVHWIPIVE